MFAYGIECSVSNAYVLDKFAEPIEHAHSGRFILHIVESVVE